MNRTAWLSLLMGLGWPLLAAGAAPVGAHGAASAPTAHAAAPPAANAALPAAPIDINRASRAQLKTLPGIGDAEAERIVAGRPYLSKAGLVTAKVIPAGMYQSIRHRIVAIQKKTADKRRPAPPASAARTG